MRNMMRRNPDRPKDPRIEPRKILAVGFGRNYFYALTEHFDNQTSTDENELLNSDPPWQDALPLSTACTVQSTVIVTQQGQVYQTGTLHGRVYPTWVHIEIPMPLRCVEVAAGRHFCLARMEGGKAVLSWGAGHFGQLGVVTAATHRANDDSGSVSSNGSSGRSPSNRSSSSPAPTAKCITFTTQPILIERLLPAFTGSPIQTIAAGDWHGLAVTESGQVWAWGSNQSLQCGIQLSSKDSAGNLMGTIALPLPISGIPPMKQVAAGRSHSCALTAESGKIFCWGNSSVGQCGTGVTARRSVKGLPPSPVQGLPSSLEMIQIAAAGNHCICLSKAGRVFTWGDGREGQLGISISTSSSRCLSLQDHQSNKPRLVADLDFVAVAASHDFPGQPGSSVRGENSSETASSAAAALALVPRIVSVHAADNSCAAVSSSGHLYCWGSNDVGHLGLPKPAHTCRELATTDPSENHNETLSHYQNFHRGRDLNLESFDSNHNVVLPTRVEKVDALFVGMIAFGPNHLLCFGTEREQEFSSVIIGRTLHEAQYDQVRSQQSDLLLTTKPIVDNVPADKMEQENTAPCLTDWLQASNLETDGSNVVPGGSNTNGESSDVIDSAKATSSGIFLDEVTQSMGNTSLSSTNTAAAAVMIEGDNVSTQRECVQAPVESVQPVLEPNAETLKMETKRPGAIRRLSNRLLRRRQAHGKK